MTKKELQLIINNQWNLRRALQKERNLKNSQAAKKWKAREQALLEQVKTIMSENIKRQHHYLENSKNQKKTD